MDFLGKQYDITQFGHAVFWYEVNQQVQSPGAQTLTSLWNRTFMENTSPFDLNVLDKCQRRPYPYDQINSSYINGYVASVFNLDVFVMAVGIKKE